jgi:hypothetical protein
MSDRACILVNEAQCQVPDRPRYRCRRQLTGGVSNAEKLHDNDPAPFTQRGRGVVAALEPAQNGADRGSGLALSIELTYLVHRTRGFRDAMPGAIAIAESD